MADEDELSVYPRDGATDWIMRNLALIKRGTRFTYRRELTGHMRIIISPNTPEIRELVWEGLADGETMRVGDTFTTKEIVKLQESD